MIIDFHSMLSRRVKLEINVVNVMNVLNVLKCQCLVQTETSIQMSFSNKSIALWKKRYHFKQKKTPK